MAKRSMISEFVDFVKSGDLVSIAAAFIIGVATATLVTSFTKEIAMGVVGLFVDCKDIGDPPVRDCSGLTGKAWKSVGWGNFLNEAVTFLITMLVVFLIVKTYRKMTAASEAAAGPSDNDLLVEIRDALKTR